MRTRGPTLSEISYTLAEITEIKLEIAKSTSQKKSRACAEIRNQSIVSKFSVKSSKFLHSESVNSDIFATCNLHVSLHGAHVRRCQIFKIWNEVSSEGDCDYLEWPDLI